MSGMLYICNYKPATCMAQTRNNKYNTLIMMGLLPPPITSCDVRKFCHQNVILALSRMSFAHRGRAFLCLCLCAFSLLFISCEHLEDPSHSILEDYFYESQGLKLASNDSIRCFSEKVKTFANCTPSAKNDPLFHLCKSACTIKGYAIFASATCKFYRFG